MSPLISDSACEPRKNIVHPELRGKSVVAAILDSYGGVRVVVSRKSELKHLVRHDELCVIVPNVRVREPIPWNWIPNVIRGAHAELDRWIATRNDEDYGGFREHVVMRRLRELEHSGSKHSLHLPDIVTT